MLLHLGTKPTLVVSSAETAREIMKTHDLVFSNRPTTTVPSILTYESKDVAFAPHGEYWRQIRSICVVQLLSNKRVASFRSVREEETFIMIEKIKGSCFSPKLVVNLSEMVISLTNNVVCRVALGRKYSSEDDEQGMRFKRLLYDFVELLGVFDVGDYIPWLRWVNYLSGLYGRANRVAKDLDEFLESVVEEHLERGQIKGDENKDFVDVLLEYQRKNTSDFSISREGIKALILDVFSAGTHTTYTALEWALTELMRHPVAHKNLQNEVRGIAKSNQIITEDDLPKMPYLKAVLKESLRLHPPVPLLVPRESTQNVKLMGYDIEAKTQVLVNAWAIGRDPLAWAGPEAFRPERFLNSSVDFRGHDFGLVPFGAGRRGCPGIEFGIRVDELALANLVRRFDFDLPDGMEAGDLDTGEMAGITTHKKVPLRVVARLAPEK